MSEAWLLKEYRDCVALCAAVRLLRNATGGDAIPFLSPLRSELVPAVDRLFARLEDYVEKGAGGLESLAPDYPPAELVGTAVLEACQAKPLTEARLIAWWLRAGPIRKVLIKRAQKPSAIGTSLTRIIPFRKPKGDAAQAEAAAAGRRSDVATTVDALLDGSAVWWCSEHAERFALSEERFLKPPQGIRFLMEQWKRTEVQSEQAPRRSLIRWCCWPERPELKLGNPNQNPEGWLRAYQKKVSEIAAAASHLLGESCRLSQTAALTMADIDAWELFDVVAWLKTPSRVVHPPLLAGEQPAKPIVRGRVLTQPIDRLFAALKTTAKQWTTPTERPAVVVLHAIDALPGLQPNLRKLSGLPPWKKVAGEQGSISLEELHCSILGVGRLLLALAVTGDAGSGPFGSAAAGKADALEEVRKSLHLDGFRIEAKPEESPCRRIIPIAGCEFQVDSAAAAVGYRLACQDTSLLLGSTVQSEAPAADHVIDAIENFDWTVWFLDWARDQAQKKKLTLDNLESAAASTACTLLKPDLWERIKRRLLTKGSDLEVVRRAFDYFHRVQIGLRQAGPRLDRLGGFRERLLSEVRMCETAVLEEAYRLDPENAAGIFPPRRRDGGCDLKRLVREPACHDSRADRWKFHWEPSAEAIGEVVRESFTDDGRVQVVLSAGALPAADVRYLNAPFVLCCPQPPVGEYYGPLHDFGRRVCDQLDSGTELDIAGPLRGLRRQFETTEGQRQFDAFMHGAIDEGDEDAVAWLDLLSGDPRFDWCCFPRVVRTDAGRWQPERVSPEEQLCWVDSAEHPTDTTIGTVYALDADRGRRTLSRGQPAADSAEALAGRLTERLAAFSAAARSLGEQLQLATDRRRFFGDAVPHPVVEALPPLLACLAGETDWDEGVQADAYRLIAGWCRAVGHILLPEAWEPQQGSPGESAAADGSAAPDRPVRFHPTIPAGNLVVEAFGVSGPHGRDLQASLSAGSAPRAYQGVFAALDRLEIEADVAAELRNRVQEFPRRILAGKQHLAGPALFDAAWNAVAADGRLVEQAEQFTEAIAELLLEACQVSTFIPSTVGEFPSGWICDGEGNAAAGTWIKRVVRPGLRTAKNKLVWPAVVEME